MAAAQAAQMQAFWRWSAGTRASKSSVNVAWVHQHGGCFWPVARSTSMAHWLSLPHSGHTSGLGAGRLDMVFTV